MKTSCLAMMFGFGLVACGVSNEQSTGESTAGATAHMEGSDGDRPYTDDRSTPMGTVNSFISALNRKEFSRAYAYWTKDENGRPLATPLKNQSYGDWTAGYKNLDYVDVTIGNAIFGGGGAGTTRYAVPAVMETTNVDGSHERFVACYTVAWTQPGNFASTFFDPMSIDEATAEKARDGAEISSLLNDACGVPPPSISDAGDSTYLDDRTTPETTLASFFNALDRKEFSRGYSYWMGAASGQPSAHALQGKSFQEWRDGYADLAHVEWTIASGGPTGTAAGTAFSPVAAVLDTTKTDGTHERFVGCYMIAAPDPLNYSVPGWVPMAIEEASAGAADPNVDPHELLAGACAQLP